MRILVTGSRDWTDWTSVAETMIDAVLDYAQRNEMTGPTNWVTIVHGACPTGADQIADEVADWLSWKVERHPADWKKYGKAAGPIRNEEMVALGADLVLAFPKGKSNGTRNCITLASEAGIPVRVLEGYDPKADNHGDEDYDKL